LDKTVQKIPFLRISAALIAGILLGSVFHFDSILLLGVLVLTLGILSWINYRYRFQLAISFGAGVHVIFVVIGMLVYGMYNREPVFQNDGKFSATVLEIVQEKPNSYGSVLKLNAFFRNDSVLPVHEKIMVWFAKTDKAKNLEPGETILFSESPQRIKNRNNPYEFDYKTYLERKKIYRQVYLTADSWIKTELQPTFSFSIVAEKIRMYLLGIYRQQNLGERELEVLSALTLGYKRGLDPETKRIFASAGAMHVLAVSGLHVGIVFLVLSFVFGILKKQKTGRFIFVLLVVMALWGFAFITGLSPSVKRAATMFTFVVVGQNLKRQYNIYNTLAASAFFLLLVNPNNLFEAGFQLSYAAVFGIIFLQPRFEKIIRFESKIIRWFWSLLTVSVAAQIATFPFSVFYFGQFPSYFWISNLLVIPAAFLLIPLGMALLVFSWVPFLSFFIVGVIDFVLWFVIHFLEMIENMPLSVIELSFSGWELAFVFGIFISIFLFMETRSKRYFKGALICFFLFVTVSLIFKTTGLFRKELIVYNYPEQTVVHLVSGKRNYIVSEEIIPEREIAANLVKNTVRKLRLDPPVYLLSGQTYSDSIVYLKNDLLLFNNRVIWLSGEKRWVPDQRIPADIIIGPYTGNDVKWIHFQGNTIVSTRKFWENETPEKHDIFYLCKKGAFREKW
jgi:competence protein ComEC